MEHVKVEGVVVRSVTYGESSKILTILTNEYGPISAIAKGCRNVKSKLRGVSGNLTYGLFYLLYKTNGLSTLTSVDVIDPLISIHSDIEKISYATYLLELTEQVMKESTSDEVFPLFTTTLKKIEEGLSPRILSSILELKYLEFLGVAPVVSGCVLCGNQKNIQTISIEAGGYLCNHCYQNGKIYSDKVIQLLRMFLLVDLHRISKLDIQDSIMIELETFLDEYYDQYTGLYLHSKKFLRNLMKVGSL